MIEVHRLNGEAFLLNSDMIETIDVTPDTVLRLLNGHRYVVKEKVKDVYRKIIAFRKAAGCNLHNRKHGRRGIRIIIASEVHTLWI